MILILLLLIGTLFYNFQSIKIEIKQVQNKSVKS